MSAAAGSFLSGLAGGYSDGRGILDRKKFLDSQAQRPDGGAQASSTMGATHPPAPQGGAGRSISGAAPASGPLSANASAVYKRFISAGVSPVMAAGLTGNIMQEGGPQVDPNAVGDNGNAFGAPQLNGPRKDAYFAWAKQKGVMPGDLNAQVDYLMHEGRTTEQGAWNAIASAKTPQEAAQIASEKFWRPGQPHMANRVSYAQQVYHDMNPQPAQPAMSPATVGRSVADGMGRGDFMVRRFASN